MTLGVDALERLADLVADRIAERQPVAPTLVDAGAAAEQLGVPASWLMTQAREGRAPHRKLGKYVRFEVGELRAWADTHAHGPRTRAA